MVLIRWPYAALALQMWAESGLALPQAADTPYSATRLSALPAPDVALLSTNNTTLAKRINPTTALTLGFVSAIMGIIASTEGMTATTITLRNMFHKKDENHVVVRFVAGKGQTEENEIEGRPPSIVFFDSRGKRIGYNHQKGHHIKEGNYRDVTVKTPGTNERPEYIAIVAQHNDPICLSGVFLAYADGYNHDGLLGDVVHNCGGTWAWSTNTVGEHPKAPTCGWLAPWSADTAHLDNPTQNAWSWHIPDFHATDARVQQYQEEPKTMCVKDARFKMHYSLGNEDDDTIPIFDELPLPLNNNLSDVDTFYFGFLPTRQSDPIDHTLARRASGHGESSVKATRERHANCSPDAEAHHRWKRYLLRSLEKGPQSAELLCNSPTSLSADWFSYDEDQLCQIETRELFRRCHSDDDFDCFDFESDHIRGKQDCGAEELCRRGPLGHRVLKSYEIVADASKGENAQYDGSI